MITAETNMDTLGVELDNERGAFMFLYTGGKFFPMDPRESEVRLTDIAHSLSFQNRFNGHTKAPYNVAQHSVLCARLVEGDKNTKLATLLHDAAEAYIGDVIRPVKVYLDLFKDIEDKVEHVIMSKYKVKMTPSVRMAIKQVDNLVCRAEKRDLHPTELEWPGMSAPSYKEVPLIKVMSPMEAEMAFLGAFDEYYTG